MPHASGIHYVTIFADSVIGLLIVAFILLAFRDVLRLRTGLSRAWAIGRVSLFDAWSARIWVLPLIWLFISVILCLAIVRGYTPGSKVRLELTIFLRAQEVLLLVYLGILACLALPRERERRTLITTGAKPISRLELLLGKVFGLWAAGLVMLLVMMLLTWGYMTLVDGKIRSDARSLYNQEKHGYEKMMRRVPPQPGLRLLAENGVLQAQNNLTGTLRIAGQINYASNPPRRELKGGSSETLYFEFPSLPASFESPPVILFDFGIRAYSQNPGPVKIHCTLLSRANPMTTEEKSLTLDQTGTAEWFVKHTSGFFSYRNPATGALYDPGPVVIRVTCTNPMVYLRFFNGVHRTNGIPHSSCYVAGLDPDRTANHAGYVFPKPNPVITGFKSNGKQEIVGPSYRHPGIPPEVASFEFKHLNPLSIPATKDGKFSVNLMIGVDKQENEQLPALAAVQAYTTAVPRDRVTLPNIRIDEKHVTPIKLPRRLLTQGGNLIITLVSEVPGHWLKLTPGSVTIVRPASPFIINLLKSELVIFCEVALLIAIGVVAGTRLGWPVALLTTMVCYMLGNLFAFVANLYVANGFELLNYVENKNLQGVWYYQIGSIISAGMTKVLYILVHLLPDFTRFNPLHFIVRSLNMPWQILAINVFWTLVCVLPTLALGYLLLRKQELA